MKFRLPGSIKDAEAMAAYVQELGLDIEVDGKLEGSEGPLGQPIEWAPGRTCQNRFAVHPMEGWDGTEDGRPTELTLRRWRRFGRSAAALVWGGEAFAVQEDGRANPNQLFLGADDGAEARATEDLAALREEILAGRREVGAAEDIGPIGLQLTHSGRWSRPFGPPAPRPATRDTLLDARAGADAELLSDDELRAIAGRYLVAARAAAAAGYDFVDVKACHGYLLHELLGARGRTGAYGGDALDHRMALLTEIIESVKEHVPGLEIGVRVSLHDVVPHRPGAEARRGVPAADRWSHGFGLDHEAPTEFSSDEPDRLLAHLHGLGVRLVNVTLGSPYYNPHLQRPAAYPPSDGYQPFADPLAFVARHLEAVRRAKARFPDMLFVGTGYSYLMDWLPHVAQAEVRRGGVDFVGIGRMVLSYPELPRDVLEGRAVNRKLVCRTFSDCTTAPRNGIVSGCFPLDDLYRKHPDRPRLEAIKKAMREEAKG